MNKTWIIIKREYSSRVRKKTFIISTILTPLLFAVVIGVVIFITVKGIRNEKIAVVDPSGILKLKLTASKAVTYEFRSDIDTGNFVSKGFSAMLLAPNTGINNTSNFKVITQKSMSRAANSRIEKDVSMALENNIIADSLKIDPQRIEDLKKQAGLTPIESLKKDELGSDKKASFNVASVIGYITAFLIYITLFVYGVMVMRGVMEEKTNRIAEVMVSSVKPYQLMMGKIIGIGAVGLTQFLLWIVLLFGISTIMMAFIPAEVMQQVQQQGGDIPGASAQTSDAMRTMATAGFNLSTVNWPVVISSFIFYFIGGYLFYASLFAAVGSAVNEDSADAQSLSLPITMPIIIAIFIMMNAINDPTSSLAIWSSLIPFFSPIVMMARIPFGVPDTVAYWELATSMILLIAGFLGTTWLSAKIYRTGILMYGKKPTWKEMAKWLRR
ncbi:MAG: ABC transporter permease [Bacteroidota bacterium]